MTPDTIWLVSGAVGVIAWILTAAVRRYAIAGGMIDVPGNRSSHQAPTPRGGGAAIALATLSAWAWLAVAGGGGGLPFGVLAGAVMVAAVGFIDDHGHLSPGTRLAGHFGAAIIAVWSLGGAPPLPVFGETIHPGGVGGTIAVIFVVWMINLTNFMDGIDGLAGGQAVSVCAAGAALCLVAAPGAALWREPMVLAAGAAGFLLWNWPPARIFMGDVGSGYLGFMIAVFSIRSIPEAPQLVWAWLILSAVFVSDATVTLLGRAVRRENVTAAHRSHAYQHLAAAWGSHRDVTLLVLGVNLLYLTPLAYAVTIKALDGTLGAAAAYVPIAIAVLRVRSARTPLQSENH